MKYNQKSVWPCVIQMPLHNRGWNEEATALQAADGSAGIGWYSENVSNVMKKKYENIFVITTIIHYIWREADIPIQAQ